MINNEVKAMLFRLANPQEPFLDLESGLLLDFYHLQGTAHTITNAVRVAVKAGTLIDVNGALQVVQAQEAAPSDKEEVADEKEEKKAPKNQNRKSPAKTGEAKSE